ncbi:MAG: hypothetical protein Q8L24_00055 [bacterium]|nr:hypothetical protein [bacterium]
MANNLFLSKAQKRRYYRKLRLKLYCYASLLFLLGVGVVYGFLSFPPFHIKKFDISGAADFEALRGEILKGSFARFLGFSNFLSWPSEVSGLKVEKDILGGTLKIASAEGDRFVIWCGKECYWIDRSGKLVEKAPDTEGSAIPKITDLSGKALKVGGAVASDEIFTNLLRIMDGLSQLSLGVSDYRFNERLQELHVYTPRSEKLIFSLRFAPSAKLFSYLKELVNSGKLHTAEYIDFTVENRIYLKTR